MLVRPRYVPSGMEQVPCQSSDREQARDEKNVKGNEGKAPGQTLRSRAWSRRETRIGHTDQIAAAAAASTGRQKQITVADNYRVIPGGDRGTGC